MTNDVSSSFRFVLFFIFFSFFILFLCACLRHLTSAYTTAKSTLAVYSTAYSKSGMEGVHLAPRRPPGALFKHWSMASELPNSCISVVQGHLVRIDQCRVGRYHIQTLMRE